MLEVVGDMHRTDANRLAIFSRDTFSLISFLLSIFIILTQVFIEAVIYSCVDRLLNESKKDEYEPTFLPLAVTTPLCTNAQSDLWDAAFRLHTGKTW